MSPWGRRKSVTAANLFPFWRRSTPFCPAHRCDLRKPTLHRLFNVTPGIGLSTAFRRERYRFQLIKIGNGNLMFLPPGKRTENPVELFSSQRMEKALVAMKYRYPDRFIIIDTPPMLLFAEAKLISTLVDGIIFVVKEGRASLQHITEALDSLKSENVMGIVYNAVGTDGLNNRYSYHSYYTDYQKSAGEEGAPCTNSSSD
jgi:Mrp family chromosome partitioning ATPase